MPMIPLPRLKPQDADTAAKNTDSVVLAVYAPFGSDLELSKYPRGESEELLQHPLVRHLRAVSKCGVHVVALVDRVGEDSYLIEIEGGRPASPCITSCWKQDMSSPHTLAGLLRRAHHRHPRSAMVLALEGHGAGYLPEIDRSKLTVATVTNNGEFDWRINGNPTPANPAEASPILPPEGSPMLPPEGSPMLPATLMPISTWGLGDALRRAQACGVPKLAVLHFNNCFNMSVEVMHTVARHVEYATGYINYNFFTSGETYPWVFGKLAAAGAAPSLDLARWFADGNELFLGLKRNHPTVGSVVPLRNMEEIGKRINALAAALLAAMRNAGAQRPVVIDKIKAVIKAARQYDTPNGSGFELETPDELTDIRSLAIEMQKPDFGPHPVRATALALANALVGIRRYGAIDVPWVNGAQKPPIVWDFTTDDMAMNILLPDPLRLGLWDWRSPFYLNGNPGPNSPQTQVINFLKAPSPWADFVREYHEDDGRKPIKFVGFLPAKLPLFPVFQEKFVAPKDWPRFDQPNNPDRPTGGSGPVGVRPKPGKASQPSQRKGG
jgi:hypothetical protein